MSVTLVSGISISGLNGCIHPILRVIQFLLEYFGVFFKVMYKMEKLYTYMRIYIINCKHLTDSYPHNQITSLEAR